ncbi:amino acid ABC transporter permease [Amycolatopsis sp. FU40]|uniref:amino acid ABC transporter permease n=1 Tax=Amycolatopsis sp. FU40 TaxID=2914159 RepID=UPI001F296D0F|nr:amino acid ABC transporter permease [Amycolatopsis sp. FU40]UKD57076.1 amino acid ABC transporter permease [Amycolatopsis sp. FU40]
MNEREQHVAASPPAAAAVPDTVARKRHYGRWLSAAVLAAIAALVVKSLAQNPQLDWSVVGRYLADGLILNGLGQTLVLSVVAMLGATAIGLVFGFFRLSKNPVLGVLGNLYVWVFRSVPALIQILFWGNLALFAPHLTLGIPGTSWVVSAPTNDVLSPFAASIIALSLANGAYLAEIIRSGLLSVEEGQHLAASAVGLTWWQAQRKVILPQALRVMIPPAGNQFITLLKETSLVSVIAGGDILSKAENISGYNLRTIELLIVAAIWYLLVTSAATAGQNVLERRMARGANQRKRKPRSAPPAGNEVSP